MLHFDRRLAVLLGSPFEDPCFLPTMESNNIMNVVQSEFFSTGNNYEEVSLIGNGAYGTVYKAKDLSNNGHIVALKKVRIPLTDDGIPQSTLREIAMLKRLDRHRHPNIVRLLDVCQGQRIGQSSQIVLFLVFEHVHQDLASYMQRCPPPGLSRSKIKDITRQILSGVDFLHTHRMVHRDLKPQNILITSSGDIKVADFGLAKTYDFDMKLTSVVVTLWYRSPEVLLGQTYATPIDIWSCGCIMAEMFKLEPVFCGTSEGDQLNRIFEVIGTPSLEEWPKNVSLEWSSFTIHEPQSFTTLLPSICQQGTNLLKSMLSFNPITRITAAQALKHPFFHEM